jgi:hypothetical protein
VADKHWYMQLDVADIYADPELSLCADATWGIWFKALCVMHMKDRCGQLVGPAGELARLCRTTVNGMRAAIDDLKSRNAADVEEDDVTGIVTLTNRRMRREWTDRKLARDRKQRQRERESVGTCPADVTPNVPGGVTRDSKSKSHNKPPLAPTENEGKQPEYPEGLMRVWNAAPPKARERSSKLECLTEWKKQKLEPRAAEMLIALEAWKQCADWRKDGGQFVKGLHLWLKHRKYEEPPTVKTARAAANTQQVSQRREIEDRAAHDQAVADCIGALSSDEVSRFAAEYRSEFPIARNVELSSASFREFIYERKHQNGSNGRIGAA